MLGAVLRKMNNSVGTGQVQSWPIALSWIVAVWVGWLVTGLIITFSEFPVPLILLRQHVKQRPGLQLGYVAQLPGLAEIFFRIFTYKDK